MAKDVRELTGADLFEAAFGERPKEPLTLELWKERFSREEILAARPEAPRCPKGAPYVSEVTFFPALKKP